MRVLYLSNRVPWFGAHTGYEQLPRYLEAPEVGARTYPSHAGLFARGLGKVISLWRGHGRVSQGDAFARWRLELALRCDGNAVGHILYGEDHLPFWHSAPVAIRRRTILTLHQPTLEPEGVKRDSLAGLPHVIVLWQRELDRFREQTGGKVYFVPHGVDTEFFSPAPDTLKKPGPPRLLYVGVHLRNIEMLSRLIPRLLHQRGDLQFDFLVPAHRRSEPGFAKLANLPNIRWHAGVDDQALRELYRAAHVLLLPLNHSGANTAVVEALACGLPLATTDVGGIRDYGGGTIFPVVENDDDEGMLALIDRYLAPDGWRNSMARQCRVFAEEQLAWPIIARRHVGIYREVRA